MSAKIKNNLNNHWWFRRIRGYSWFSFRYWWVNYLLWILFFMLLLLLFLRLLKPTNNCYQEFKEINKVMDNIHRNLENCCPCKPNGAFSGSVAVTDSLYQLRDSLGGKVGEITVTLTWNTYDDLDLHLKEPSGRQIWYNKKKSNSGGVLDIDANAQNRTNQPIENIYYEQNPPIGLYSIYVTYYSKKDRVPTIPYRVFVKIGNQIHNFYLTHERVREKTLVYEFYYDPFQ